MGHVIGIDTTYTGNPVSFNAVNGGTMKSVSVPISYTQDLHGYANPWIDAEYDKVPYNFRAVYDTTASRVGNSELGSIVGGTVAWNQVVPTASINWTNEYTDTKALNFYFRKQTSPYTTLYTKQNVSAGLIASIVSASFTGNAIMLHSGTQRNLQYVSNIPIISGHKYYFTINFTNVDATTVGGAVAKDIQVYDLTTMFGSTIADYIYTLESGTAGAGVAKLKSWGFFTKDYYAYDTGSLQSVNTSTHKTYKADNTLLGNYALDSSLTLRGIPKLDANNNLYYDGDVYAADGTVTRKYGSRAYQNGDATDGSTMITDGTNTVYKLITPTTETATAYAATQSIDPDGTEEYVDYAESQGTRDVAIPVGHDTNYANICPISGLASLSVYVSPTHNVVDATTYAVDWSTQAGTVYGGTVDVVTGQLTVNRYTKSFTGTESYTNYTSVIVCNETLPVGLSTAGSDILCSHSTNQYVHFSNSSKTRVQFNKATFGVTSVDELKTLLENWNTAGTPLQYSYELATPLTYQLTPKQIAALIGQNYIWSSNNETLNTVLTAPATGFAGWLIKCVTNGTPVEIPLKYMRAETYTVTPDQRMEWSAERDVTGVLHRETVQNLPPKIEFSTPLMSNSDINALNSIIKAAFTSYLQRNITIQFYDPERNQYWEWDCYMPDVKYHIRNADTVNNIINYEELRYAFIGY